MAKIPVKHIGIFQAICDRRRKADLRTDLGVERYKRLGVIERYKDEAPYRICPKCIAVVKAGGKRKPKRKKARTMPTAREQDAMLRRMRDNLSVLEVENERLRKENQ